ncbi:hypothetical protein MKX42_14210 [Paenibacillus sp. FSL R7-0204]|uniref:hypothetical protein n=1 Tax=Paenibacillus sp. FSL R7-0204 TaxID=2921675 RepID=UPI0030FA8FC1
MLKSGAKLASKSGRMIIRNGKIVIKSLQKGLMKGAKKLRGLLDRILQKFKFKKFKLVRKGKYIRLYGEVNPWVLLIDGTIQEVDSLDGRKAGINTQAELDKIKSLKPSERIDVYNNAVTKPDGKLILIVLSCLILMFLQHSNRQILLVLIKIDYIKHLVKRM